jgi:ATP-dependent RNA helicase DBP3
MAATKHTLADDESTRPIKKSKLQNDNDDSQLKKEKKDRKKEKKDKKRKLEDSEAVNGDEKDSDLEAQRKAEKKAKKKEKRLREAQASAESTTAEEPSKTKKSNGKEGKVPNAGASATASGPYAQTISLTNVPQAEIDTFMSTNQITVTDPRGETASLRPVTEFRHLPSTNLLEKTPSPFANYKVPTPIQAASWPSTLSGRDVIGVAETGSGKTMAFALPCVEAVSAIGKKGTKAVVVSPTRELAMQTHTQLVSLAALAKLKCVCLYGGASKDDQRALINRGADIIVATPGRL